MKIIMSHPTGNANVRAAASGMKQAGILAEFNTAIATFPGSLLDRFSTLGPLSELSRRSFDPALQGVSKMHPWKEVARLAASKTGLSGLTRHETGPFCIDAVYRNIDKRVARRIQRPGGRKANAVYAYEDGAEKSFLAAKRMNMQCLYDLPIGYWRAARQLLQPELERWPDWAVTLSGMRDSEAKLARKDRELELADQVFVASRFTAQTLSYYPGKLAPVRVIPYGFPPATTGTISSFDGSRRLKLLFVGSLSQRKGIANLFEAVAAFPDHIELTVVGQKGAACAALDKALLQHRWIPSLPHGEVLKLMAAQDVFVFPSLFEGFGLVITEAMSQGTPVITTERTAGPDLINHEHNGWLVDAGSTEALKASFDHLLTRPALVKQAGAAAVQTALERPWSVYGKELAEAIIASANNKTGNDEHA